MRNSVRRVFALTAPWFAIAAGALAANACSTPASGPTTTDASTSDAVVADTGAVVSDAGPPPDTSRCSAGTCAVGDICAGDSDCASKNCVASVCKSPSCSNGKRDGAEEGTDCGGTCSTKCDGQACASNGDCASRACVAAVCAPVGTKTCGVGVATLCMDGDLCDQDKDCTSVYCSGNVCSAVDAASHHDGRLNAGEAGIDCGGVIKATALCDTGATCIDSTDCKGVCNAGKTCDAMSPTDGKKNNGETDVDCGGPNAPKCAPTKECAAGTDCFGGFCEAQICKVPTRADGITNGTETDVDCGGTAIDEGGVVVAAAPRCVETKTCAADADCGTAVCSASNKCVRARSCKTGHFGVDTCGAREDGDPGVNHDSCCTSLPLPASGGIPANSIRLDKYEITAGRMRQFITAVATTRGPDNVPYGGNIQKWAADQRAANTPAGQSLTTYLRSDMYALLPTSDDPNVPLNSFVQLGGTTMDTRLPSGVQGCAMSAGGYGHATYWAKPADLAWQGYPAREHTSDELDNKSMNCSPYWMFAAFCAWDGGHVATSAEASVALGAANYPWGPGSLPTLDTTNAAVPFDYERSWNMTNNVYKKYRFPGFESANDLTPFISAPGRFPLDASALKSLGQSWMDLGGNMIEWTSTIRDSPATYLGISTFYDYSHGGPDLRASNMPGMYAYSGSWEGHGYTKPDWGFPAHTMYGKLGARCARPY